MNNHRNFNSTNARSMSKRSLFAATAAAVASAMVLVACGGGSDADGGANNTATGGAANTVAWASGPITGLGSIIVNGIRYEDSAARVEDDDGGQRSRDSLKLGMMVEVNSSRPDDASARADASTVRFGSEIVGPIAAANATNQTLTILGQTVEITSTTVIDDSLGTRFADLTVGKVVEVHALFDATSNRYVATRIEDKAAPVVYRLRGTVSALDATAKTFKLGDAVINYASLPAASVPSNLANGQRVRVQLQTTQVNGQWVATSVGDGVRRVDDRGDARLRGIVSNFTSAQSFEINGMKVNASNATFTPSAAAVVAGARVDVRGSVVNGVLVATRVQAKGASDDDSWGKVELHGTVSALNTTAKTMVVREVSVDYSGVTEWKDGAESNLANGRRLEVKGTWSADRTSLRATRIEFED
jgi:hypothetical protein